jgi:hypothetical protein
MYTKQLKTSKLYSPQTLISPRCEEEKIVQSKSRTIRIVQTLHAVLESDRSLSVSQQSERRRHWKQHWSDRRMSAKKMTTTNTTKATPRLLNSAKRADRDETNRTPSNAAAVSATTGCWPNQQCRQIYQNHLQVIVYTQNPRLPFL